MEHWDYTDVCRWLTTLGNGGSKYEELFRKERIDGATLQSLTEHEMKHELGISELGIRRLLTREVAKNPVLPPKEDSSQVSPKSTPNDNRINNPSETTIPVAGNNVDIALNGDGVTGSTSEGERTGRCSYPIREIATPAPPAAVKFRKRTSCSPAPPLNATFVYKTPVVDSRSTVAYQLRNLRTPAESTPEKVSKRSSLTPVSSVSNHRSPLAGREPSVVAPAAPRGPVRHIATPQQSDVMVRAHPHAARSRGVPKSPPPPNEPSPISVNGYSPPPVVVTEKVSSIHPHLVDMCSSRPFNNVNQGVYTNSVPISPDPMFAADRGRKASEDSSSAAAFLERSTEIEALARVVNTVSRGTETPEFRKHTKDKGAQSDLEVLASSRRASQDPTNAAAFFGHIEAIGQSVRSKSPKASRNGSISDCEVVELPLQRRRFGEPKREHREVKPTEHKAIIRSTSCDSNDDPPEPSLIVPIALSSSGK
eukprot:TRINITY_DN4228_c0_g2_i1.p1 TRINITY_DN4228_c0_g2~~TRINITY_DN4228_c0_g2_i1.p1  ORF type:complete len:480 (+),score=51.54 TRINITY_DN4228_c0_g2_i1:51-1490(+)